jgi:catechol 2,3-dioxygenase-like lactoylglutathione lyase family enzyme
MPVKLENVGIAVRDLDAAIAFFTDLGLTVLGRARISGARCGGDRRVRLRQAGHDCFGP